jgi:hypothetical protein
MTSPKGSGPAIAQMDRPREIEMLGSTDVFTPLLAEFQARWLTRRLAVDLSMAAAIVPFVFGGAHAQNSP